MAAAYDTYDYPAYWLGREYEHKSEEIAIRTLLAKIPQVKSVLEIGAGFGRLVPSYSFRAKKIILSDPSAKILSLARKAFKKEKNISFIHSSLENLPSGVRKDSSDLIILVRVLHHLEDIKKAIQIITRLLKKDGFFILEFANKSHLKATLEQIFRGNITFPLDIFPKEIKCSQPRKKSLPFKNYHPDAIKQELKTAGLRVIERLSVSNIRSRFLKKYLPLETLLAIEKVLQKPLSYLNFGPSIFILAQKT